MGEQGSSFPDIPGVLWAGHAVPGAVCRGSLLRLSLCSKMMLLNPAGHRAGCQGCPEPPTLPGELSGTPCALWDHLLWPVCLCFSCGIVLFHGAKSLPRAPPSLLGITTNLPSLPLRHPWGLGPPGDGTHVVTLSQQRSELRPGLSRGTEINIKSWQSNEPKIQRQNKLLIARAGSARPGPVTGHLGVYVTP